MDEVLKREAEALGINMSEKEREKALMTDILKAKGCKNEQTRKVKRS